MSSPTPCCWTACSQWHRHWKEGKAGRRILCAAAVFRLPPYRLGTESPPTTASQWVTLSGEPGVGLSGTVRAERAAVSGTRVKADARLTNCSSWCCDSQAPAKPYWDGSWHLSPRCLLAVAVGGDHHSRGQFSVQVPGGSRPSISLPRLEDGGACRARGWQTKAYPV